MKTKYYSMSIGTGTSVFFVETPDPNRVSHEVQSLPDGWTVNIWVINADGTPIRKCDPKEFSVITVSQAEPIIQNWISEAVAEIEAKTGAQIDSNDILEQLADCEWLFCVTVDEEETKINMISARAQLDHIVERNIKLIKEEI